MSTRLTVQEMRAFAGFVSGVRGLLAMDSAAVGRVADYVGEYGIDEATELQDGVIMACLRVAVDAMGREKK